MSLRTVDLEHPSFPGAQYDAYRTVHPLCKDIPYGLDAQSKFLARNLQFLEALHDSDDKKRPGMIWGIQVSGTSNQSESVPPSNWVQHAGTKSESCSPAM